MEKTIVSIVLGSYNRRSLLKLTLESVRNNGCEFPYEIIVVDGGSTDGSLNYLAKQKDVVTIIQHNHGEFNGRKVERKSWGYFMNLAFKAAHGKYILMISDDCLVIPGSIANGINHFETLLSKGEKIGAMAFYWRNWPEQIQYSVGLFCDRMYVNHGLYLRSVLNEVSFINEDDFKFYYADSDLCMRIAERGYQVMDAPTSIVEHYSHANLKIRSKNESSVKQDESHFLNKWQSLGTPVSTWKTLDYTDPNGTLPQYWGHLIVKERLVNLLRRTNIKKYFKGLLRRLQ